MQNNYNKLYFLGFLLFIIIAGISLTKFYLEWQRFLVTPIIPPGKQLIYVVNPGTTIKKIASDLHTMGYLQAPHFLIRYVQLMGQASRLKFGEYQFEGGITPSQFLKKLTQHQVLQHRITFIEGWTFPQIQHALAQAVGLQHSAATLNHATLMLKIGSSFTHPEGLFFPDTYVYVLGDTDFDILKTSYAKMQQILNEEWRLRDENLHYKTPYEALIVASMVEKEAKFDYERPLIASVISNRLSKNMYLQIDPTVVYALGNFYNGYLTRANLGYYSPYNTYRNKGLPPTPIAMPGRQSLYAALHPLVSDKLYFVARGDGSHIFTATLKEHNKSVSQHLLSKSKNFEGLQVITLGRSYEKILCYILGLKSCHQKIFYNVDDLSQLKELRVLGNLPLSNFLMAFSSK